MRELSPEETARVFAEIRELDARAKERGSGLPPDLEELAARIFGEERAPDFGGSLERLLVALVALRTAFVADPPTAGRLGREVFLQALERIARAAGSTPTVVHGDISTDAPTLLINPLFWLEVDRIREKALSGDKASFKLFEEILCVLAVPKRLSGARLAANVAARSEAAREIRHDPDFSAEPLYRLAVEISRDGKRGPVPRRAAELFINAFPDLVRLRGMEAQGKRLEAEGEADPDASRRNALREKATARREEAEALRAALVDRAFTLEGQRIRTAKRERAKTRGRK